MSAFDSRFQLATDRFDAENARDPNRELVNGILEPRELIHARWLNEWVEKLEPDASEPLLLAARCQHLCRWMIPRDRYPQTRAGYLQWRTELKKFHAEKSAAILKEAGYPESIITRVQEINLKKNLEDDPDMQTMEDALCLVFLQHQFDDLLAKTDEAKMVGILQKTWKKMSPVAHEEAKELSYSARAKALLQKALS